MPACRNSEDGTEIAEARGLAGLGGGEIVARDRNRQVGPQAQLLAAGVRGQIETFADVLARQIEKRFGGLQNRRLGQGVTGLGERQQQRVRPGGGSGRTMGGGHGHLTVQIPENGFSRFKAS